MNPKDFARQLERLAALDEPLRRRLYLYVAGQGRDVGRDEAARAVRVSRALAAFHLDKLAAAGLLEVSFRRLTGRDGPGAGRTSKLYRRSATQLDVTVPERRYEWAAHVLAQAIAETDSEPAREALRKAARARGEQIAREVSAGAGRGTPLRRAERALEACGFEPERTAEGEVVLRNCPFDSLRESCRDVVCGMNLALVQGLLAGLELDDVGARAAPRPGLCCVALRARPASDAASPPAGA